MQKNILLGFDNIMKIFYQLIDALKYLHDHKLFHGDIKLENLLLDKNYDLKLADFGCSQSIEFPPLTYIRGTLGYFSPELIRGGEKDRRKADIWAAGIVLFTLFNNGLPYESKSKEDILEEMSILKYKIEKLFLPKYVINILKMCLELDEDNRATANDILNKLACQKTKLERNVSIGRVSNTSQCNKIFVPPRKVHSYKKVDNFINHPSNKIIPIFRKPPKHLSFTSK